MSRFTLTSGSLAAALSCAVLVSAASAQTAPAGQRTAQAAAGRATAPLTAVRTIEPQGKSSHAVVISGNGKYVIVADADGAVRMLDYATGKEERVFRGHTGPVPGVAISGDGRFVATAGSDKTSRVFDAATGRETGKHVFTGPVNAVWINKDGTRVLSASGKEVAVWDPTSPEGKIVSTFTGHGGDVLTVAADDKGMIAVSGAKDRTVCMWEPETGKQLHAFTGVHTGDVKSVAIDPMGKKAISGGADMIVCYWDLEAKREIKRYTNLREPVEAVTMSNDLKRAMAAGAHRVIMLDPALAAELCELAPYRFGNHCARFSPDGRSVIVGGEQDTEAAADKRGTLRVYDLPTTR